MELFVRSSCVGTSASWQFNKHTNKQAASCTRMHTGVRRPMLPGSIARMILNPSQIMPPGPQSLAKKQDLIDRSMLTRHGNRGNQYWLSECPLLYLKVYTESKSERTSISQYPAIAAHFPEGKKNSMIPSNSTWLEAARLQLIFMYVFYRTQSVSVLSLEQFINLFTSEYIISLQNAPKKFFIPSKQSARTTLLTKVLEPVVPDLQYLPRNRKFVSMWNAIIAADPVFKAYMDIYTHVGFIFFISSPLLYYLRLLRIPVAWCCNRPSG